MNKQKGLAPLLIIILIALALGGYLLYQKQTKLIATPQPVASTVASSSADISDWKTYTNTKYGFEIKYPIEAFIYVPEPDPLDTLVWIELPGQSASDASSQLRIGIEDNPKSKSAKDFCLSRWDSKYPIIEEGQTRIGNIVAHTVRVDTRISGDVSATCITKENKILVLDFDIDIIENDPLIKEHTQTLNLIISTFKFTQ